MLEVIQQIDTAILQAFASIRFDLLTQGVVGFTALGSLIVLATIFAAIHQFGDEELAIKGFLATASSSILVAFLKVIYQRPFPEQALSVNPSYFIPYSFPSGHTAAAFTAAYVMMDYTERGRYILPVIAGAVGVTRVYLGIHYPSDVVAGAFLGIAVAFLYRKAEI